MPHDDTKRDCLLCGSHEVQLLWLPSGNHELRCNACEKKVHLQATEQTLALYDSICRIRESFNARPVEMLQILGTIRSTMHAHGTLDLEQLKSYRLVVRLANLCLSFPKGTTKLPSFTDMEAHDDGDKSPINSQYARKSLQEYEGEWGVPLWAFRRNASCDYLTVFESPNEKHAASFVSTWIETSRVPRGYSRKVMRNLTTGRTVYVWRKQ